MSAKLPELPAASDEFVFELRIETGLDLSGYDAYIRQVAQAWVHDIGLLGTKHFAHPSNVKEPGGAEAIEELISLRESARVAYDAGNIDAMIGWGTAMKYYADYLLYRWSAHPKAIRDSKRQRGTQKERLADINVWIDGQLKRTPTITAPALWETAPDWLTDQIGIDAFKKRVTKRRKNAASN